MNRRIAAVPMTPREVRRTVAASLRWIADLLIEGPDDSATLDRLVIASQQLTEAERVIEMWKRIIEASQTAA